MRVIVAGVGYRNLRDHSVGVTVADRLAARGTGPTATPEMIEGHLELAREVLPEAIAWHRTGPPRSPIAGDELAAAVGIEPGPELGRLLAEVAAAGAEAARTATCPIRAKA